MSVTPSISHTFGSALRIAVAALWKHPVLGIVFLAAAGGQGLLQGVFLWVLRDVLLAFDGQLVSMATLTRGAFLIGAIWAARSVLTYLGEASKFALAYRSEIDGVHRVLAKLLALPIQFFERHSDGDLVLTSYYDLAGVRSVMIQVGTVVMTLARLVGLAAVAWVMSPKLAVVGFASIPLGALPAYWIGRRITRAARRQRGEVVRLHDVFLQLSSGIRIIKVNQGHERVRDRANDVGRALYRSEVRQAELKHLSRLMLELVSGIGLILVLVIGGRDVAAGVLDWQALLALLVAMMAVYAPVLNLLSVYGEIKTVIPRLDRTSELLMLPDEVPDVAWARPLVDTPRTITLEDLSFAYQAEPVLDGVSLTIHRGETLGVVGPSGAGKSTLLALMLRLYEPTRGRILVDGVDIRHIRRSDLLDKSAIVLQEPFLFTDTIAANIRMARPDASMEEVVAAAEAAFIHDEIMRMPDGYDTLVGRAEAGRGISVGQKQRIAIAAALLKDAPLLFLDEATSNLDSASERAVQAAITRLMRGRTTVVIAHRLSTIQRAERIIVLDRGRLVGMGRHAELIETCAVYRNSWLHQMESTRTSGDADSRGDDGDRLSAVPVPL
jgi:subfamily B ATP-binding cassette protein MsbA